MIWNYFRLVPSRVRARFVRLRFPLAMAQVQLKVQVVRRTSVNGRGISINVEFMDHVEERALRSNAVEGRVWHQEAPTDDYSCPMTGLAKVVAISLARRISGKSVSARAHDVTNCK